MVFQSFMISKGVFLQKRKKMEKQVDWSKKKCKLNKAPLLFVSVYNQ